MFKITMKSNAKAISNGFFNLRGTLSVKFGYTCVKRPLLGGGGGGGVIINFEKIFFNNLLLSNFLIYTY
jgi:hypothetical protein